MSNKSIEFADTTRIMRPGADVRVKIVRAMERGAICQSPGCRSYAVSLRGACTDNPKILCGVHSTEDRTLSTLRRTREFLRAGQLKTR